MEGSSSTRLHTAVVVVAGQERLREDPTSVFLALPYLFVPFLASRDCLALAAAGKVGRCVRGFLGMSFLLLICG